MSRGNHYSILTIVLEAWGPPLGVPGGHGPQIMEWGANNAFGPPIFQGNNTLNLIEFNAI